MEANMAIILEGVSTCTVCGAVLSKGGIADYVAFPHFITDPAHPRWRHSDSGIHRTCFQSWDHAEEFRAIFNETSLLLTPNHPRTMLADGSMVPIGPIANP
jgi:hypothetical protein